jgi:hypothetical protein
MPLLKIAAAVTTLLTGTGAKGTGPEVCVISPTEPKVLVSASFLTKVPVGN